LQNRVQIIGAGTGIRIPAIAILKAQTRPRTPAKREPISRKKSLTPYQIVLGAEK
jgi:hypothetical protein